MSLISPADDCIETDRHGQGDQEWLLPCSVCGDIGQMRHIAFQFLSLKSSANRCDGCSILLASIEAARIENGEYNPVIIVNPQEKPATGPLRVDVPHFGTRIRLQIYTLPGTDPSPWPLIGTTEHISRQGLSEKCMALARRWIEDCRSANPNHELCPGRAPAPLLPTRVINVGLTDSELRIYVAGAGETSDYIALSHCWGGTAHIKTTKAYLEQYRKILPTPLPQTFKDAVSVTRALGFQYLWIDSLCIVQDSEGDWTRESARMASVYKNAAVTISADAAPDCSAGFLNAPARTVVDALPFQHTFRDPKDNESTVVRTIYVRRKGVLAQELPFHGFKEGELEGTRPNNERSGYLSFIDKTTQSKLSTRGWVFQERALAPRTLHFSKYEMSWECKTLCDCECSTGSTRTHRTKSMLKTLISQSRGLGPDATIWRRDVIPTYSGLGLTMKSDRLLALAGFASEFSRHCGDGNIYAAGMWSRSLADDLLWYVRGPRSASRSGAKNVPSWSWAAVDAAVSYLELCKPGSKQQIMATAFQLQNVVESPVQFGTPPYMPSLLVTGLVVHAIVSAVVPSSRYPGFAVLDGSETAPSQSQEFHKVMIKTTKGTAEVEAVYDVENPSTSPGAYALLLIGREKKGGPSGLLMKRVDSRSAWSLPSFSRVGLVFPPDETMERVWSDDKSGWYVERNERDRVRLSRRTANKNWSIWKRESSKLAFKFV